MRSEKEPCVKGSLVLGAAVTVRRHRDQGRIALDQLAARLGGVALDWLDQKIDIGRWYPIRPFCELLDLDWDVGGKRSPEYMREQGARAADRLFESGIYQQLRYADRKDHAETRTDLTLRVKLITTIAGSLYDFIQAEVRVDPDDGDQIEIHWSNATAFSEALRYTTEGFMNQINQRQGSSRRWSSERRNPGLVIFRMPIPRRMADGS